MKKIGLFFVCIPIMAIAAIPSTECPSDYIAIDEKYWSIATVCPSDTVAIGTADSCLASSSLGVCIMYVPVGVSYTDNLGTYEYTDVCPLSD